MGKVEARDRRNLFAAWSRVRFDNGEQALVSMSENGITVFKLILKGMLPIKRLWSASTVQLVERFGIPQDLEDDYIEKIVDIVIQCSSSQNAQAELRLQFSN